MGRSRSVGELTAKIDKYAGSLNNIDRTVIREGLKATEGVMLAQAARAAGPDRVLSGTTRTTGPKRGTRSGARSLGVRTRVEGNQGFARAVGPWQLAEDNIAKHIVTSRYAKGAGYKTAKGRKGRSTRQSRIASVAFGLGAAGGGRRAVLHWGNVYSRYTTASSRGRHPWAKGVKETEPIVAAKFAAAERENLRRAFR